MKNFNSGDIKFLVLFIGLLSLSSVSLAQDRGKRSPPPASTEACSTLAEGDSCEFEGRRGNVSGTCSVPPSDDSVLACRPNNRPARGNRGDTQG